MAGGGITHTNIIGRINGGDGIREARCQVRVEKFEHRREITRLRDTTIDDCIGSERHLPARLRRLLVPGKL